MISLEILKGKTKNEIIDICRANGYTYDVKPPHFLSEGREKMLKNNPLLLAGINPTDYVRFTELRNNEGEHEVLIVDVFGSFSSPLSDESILCAKLFEVDKRAGRYKVDYAWDIYKGLDNLITGRVIFDNGGGAAIQLPGYAHYYSGYTGAMEQAAHAVVEYMRTGNTDGWDGNEEDAATFDPSAQDVQNGGYIMYDIGDIISGYVDAGWGNNVADFLAEFTKLNEKD